jgi:hypothetical protein
LDSDVMRDFIIILGLDSDVMRDFIIIVGLDSDVMNHHCRFGFGCYESSLSIWIRML